MIDVAKTLKLLSEKPRAGFELPNREIVLSLIKRGCAYHASTSSDRTNVH